MVLLGWLRKKLKGNRAAGRYRSDDCSHEPSFYLTTLEPRRVLMNAPVLDNPIPDQAINSGDTLSFQFAADTFSEADGDPVTYTAELSGGGALPGWLTFTAATRTFSGTPTGSDAGTIMIEVTATDTDGAISDVFDLVISDSSPVVDQGISNQAEDEDSAFNFVVPNDAFDAVDGDTLTLSAVEQGQGSLPGWLSFDAGTSTFTGTPLNADVGTVTIEVTADDGNSTVSTTFDIVVSNTNDDPTVDQGIANQAINEDSALNFVLPNDAFDDVDAGDTLTLSAVEQGQGSLPGWLSFDAGTNTFTGTPLNADVGTVTIEVTADDGNGGTAATTTFDIVISNTDDDPTVDQGISDQNATQDSLFSFVVPNDAFEDVDVGDTLTLSAVEQGQGSLPGWLSFDSGTNTFSGTPLNADVGTVTIEVTATDTDGGTTASTTFDIIVADVNAAPVLTPGTPVFTGITENDTSNIGLAVSDFTVGTISDVDLNSVEGIAIIGLTVDTGAGTWQYMLSGGGGWVNIGTVSATSALLLDSADSVRFLPDGDNGATGTFTYRAWDQTAGTAGTKVNIVVLGTGGTTPFSTATDTASITVSSVNDDPTVAQVIVSQFATEDSAYNFIIPGATFNDVDTGDTLTLSAVELGEVSLPGWLSFDPNTGTFSGTPLNADVGNVTIRVTADDGNGGSVTEDFVLNVANVNDAPILTPDTPTMTTIDENAVSNTGMAVSDIVVGTISDIDPGATQGIAIIGLTVDTGTGTWQYRLSGGGGWVNIGPVSSTSALLLDASDEIRFLPDGDNGATGTFSYRAWDQSSETAGTKVDVDALGNGGITPFSTATDTASITVTSVNDAPVLTATTPTFTTISEDASDPAGVTVSSFVGAITDVDTGAATAGIAVIGSTLSSGNGKWQYQISGSGVWNDFGAVSATASRLLRSIDLIRFLPDGDQGNTATLSFRAWDLTTTEQHGDVADVSVLGSGGASAFSSTSDTASITVTEVNDAPVLDSSAADPRLDSVSDNAGNSPAHSVSTIIGGTPINDVDPSDTLGIALTSANQGNGTWEYRLTPGDPWVIINPGTVSESSAILLSQSAQLRFNPTAASADHPGFNFRAWDMTTGSSGDTGVDTTGAGNASAFSAAQETARMPVWYLVEPTASPIGPESMTTLTVMIMHPDPTGDTFNININWGDNLSGGLSSVSAGVFQFDHTYFTAPDPQNPTASASIFVTVSQVGTSYSSAKKAEAAVLGTGIETAVVIDTSGGTEDLSFPDLEADLSEGTSDSEPTISAQQASANTKPAEDDEATESKIVLRIVSPVGEESEEVSLEEDALDNLPELFKKLPDNRYRIYLIRTDGTMLLLLDVTIRDGRPVDAADRRPTEEQSSIENNNNDDEANNQTNREIDNATTSQTDVNHYPTRPNDRWATQNLNNTLYPINNQQENQQATASRYKARYSAYGLSASAMAALVSVRYDWKQTLDEALQKADRPRFTKAARIGRKLRVRQK